MIELYLHGLIQSNLLILTYNQDAAEWHAKQRACLTNIGKTPAFADGQIAAIAHINNLTLITRNADDFRDFFDLKIENWFLD